MTQTIIRDATRADVPDIVRLLADDRLGATREDVREPLANAYWTAFDAINAQVGNQLLVAELPPQIVGCLQLTLIPGLSRQGALRAQLEGVRVASEFRGRGVGHALLAAAIERARAAGCQLLQLTTDNSRGDAQRFYASLGFEPTHVDMKLLL